MGQLGYNSMRLTRFMFHGSVRGLFDNSHLTFTIISIMTNFDTSLVILKNAIYHVLLHFHEHKSYSL